MIQFGATDPRIDLRKRLSEVQRVQRDQIDARRQRFQERRRPPPDDQFRVGDLVEAMDAFGLGVVRGHIVRIEGPDELPTIVVKVQNVIDGIWADPWQQSPCRADRCLR